MTMFSILVTQLVDDDQLSKPDDRITNPSGLHDVEASTPEAALDKFHSTVPIGCLDDFAISISETAETACKRLVEAYTDAKLRGGSICWAQLDQAAFRALRALQLPADHLD